MKTVDILTAAKALIQEPGRWNKGTAACDARGGKVAYGSPDAVSFCSFGALRRAWENCQDSRLCFWSERREKSMDAVEAILAYAIELDAQCKIRDLGDARLHWIVQINDLPETTHEDILRIFDRAIELAEAA